MLFGTKEKQYIYKLTIIVSVFLFVLFSMTQKVAAQLFDSPQFQFTHSYGDTSNDAARSVTYDKEGNLFATGYFTGTVNFNPDGNDTKVSNGLSDFYILKLKSDTTYGWTKTIGGTAAEDGKSITTDDDGNIYVTGFFNGIVNFNPDGNDTRASVGESDIFVSRWNSDGSYGWTRTFGSSEQDRGYAVYSSGQGLYITGYFRSNVDFNAGRVPSVTRTSNGGQDVFIAKLDHDSNYSWVKTFGGPNNDSGYSLYHKDNNVFATGSFSDTVDFNPGGTIDSKIANGSDDVWFMSMTEDADYNWTRSFGSSGSDIAYGIDGFGDRLYLVGYFSGSTNFDPLGSSDVKGSNGAADVFIQSVQTDGNYRWTNTAGAAGNDIARAIDVDSDGNIYVTGRFTGTVDFNVVEIGGELNGNNTDSFLVGYDTTGKYKWARNFGGNATDEGYGLAIYKSLGLAVTGYFQGIGAVFDQVSNEIENSNGGDDIYLSMYKIGDLPPVPPVQSGNNQNNSNLSDNNTSRLSQTGALLIAPPLMLMIIFIIAYTYIDFRRHKQVLLTEVEIPRYTYLHHLKYVSIPLVKYRLSIRIEKRRHGDGVHKF